VAHWLGQIADDEAMLTRIALLCACLLAASAYLESTHRPQPRPQRQPLHALPLSIGDWTGREAGDFRVTIVSALGVDDYTNRFYIGPDRTELSLYIGYYESQRQGASIHSPLNCLPGEGWNPVKHDFLQIPAGGAGIQVNRIVIIKGHARQVVLYWYQSHARVVAGEYKAKMYAVLDALRTGRTDAALIRIISPTASFEEDAEAAASGRAAAFAQALVPLLDRFIPE
jgi:EpsI family protein